MLAFIDVDGLKATNDLLGHAAGDQLLRRVVDTLRAHRRALILSCDTEGTSSCALLAMDIEKTTERFVLINVALVAHAHASISVGLAAYKIHDPLDTLLARAGRAL